MDIINVVVFMLALVSLNDINYSSRGKFRKFNQAAEREHCLGTSGVTETLSFWKDLYYNFQCNIVIMISLNISRKAWVMLGDGLIIFN